MTNSATTADDIVDVPRSRWKRVGLLLFLIYLVSYADRTNISVAVPDLVQHLRLSGTVTGLVLSAFFWGYVLTQVPGGWLAMRIGPRRVIVGAMVVVGITACLTGFAPSIEALLAVRFTMGLAEGAVFPAFAVMFLRWFPGHERGRAVSLTQYALPVSSVLMAPLAGWMISQWNFQTMFVLQGIPAFVLAALLAWLVPDDPAQDRRLDPVERDFIIATRDQETADESTFLDGLRRPIVIGLCVTYFLWITGLYAFGLWLPSLIGEFSAQGATGVGFLTAIPFAFATAAMYLNSRFSDRATISRGWFVSASMLLAGVALLLQQVAPDGLLWDMALLVCAAVGLYSAFGTWWTWALSQVPRNHAGASIGVVNLCGNFGGIVGPVVVGWAAASSPGGTTAEGFWVLGFVVLAASALAGLLALRDRPDPDAAAVDLDVRTAPAPTQADRT